MKTCKKYAVLLPRSASLHSKSLLRRRILPTLAMDLRKLPQSKAGKLLATDLRTASSNEPDQHSSDPQEHQDKPDAGPASGAAGAITITALSFTHHKLDSASPEPGLSISITKVHHSAVDLSDSVTKPFATLAINSVTESLLICGRTSGAAHITGVENSTLIIWSRQVRMHECKNCLVYLHCGSRPVIEDCNAIRFTPFPPVYVSTPFVALEVFSFIIRRQNTTGSPRPNSPNMWDQVDDFKWLRAEHSPNWNTLQPGDEGTIGSGPWEVIKSFGAPGCTLSELRR